MEEVMAETDQAVLETTRVREAMAIFQSPETLEAAVGDLLMAGFDRSDVDLMASVNAVREKLGDQFVQHPELAQGRRVPHSAFVSKEETTLLSAGAFGLLTYIGATAAALGVVASGGAIAAAAAAAMAGGAAAGSLGAIIARLIGRGPAKELEQGITQGGLVLWVRIRSPEHERRAVEILRRHGATQVETREIEIAKRLADIPLSSIRPDPWLGNERLGEV